MYKISLLPEEYKQYRVISRRSRRLLLVLFTTALSLAVVLITSVAILLVYRNQLSDIEDWNAELEKQIEALKPVEILQQQLLNMHETINQAAGLSPAWDEFVTHIGNNVPPGVAISDITAEYGENSRITILGSASSYDYIADYADYLKKVEGLDNIQVEYLEEDNSAELVFYRIDIQSVPAESYQLNLGGVHW